MSERTRFLCRLLGLYCLIAPVTMFLHREATIVMVMALLHDPPLLFMVGLLTVVAGLALVLGHNFWSGGAYTILVTIIGWITLVKGLIEWLLPQSAVAELFLTRLQYARFFPGYMALSFALGLYLAWGGFRAREGGGPA